MEEKFEVVVHHNGEFDGFTHSSYYGLRDSWLCDPNVWSYFGVLGDLKEMGYNNLESLWYYDPVLEDEIVRLRDDVGTNRIKNIAYDEGEAHLYVIHTMEEPVVEEYPTLCNFIQGPNAGGNVGPDVVDAGPSNDIVDVDNGPINDTVEDKDSGENVVEKECGPSYAFIPPVAINNDGEGVDAINTERVDAELRDNSDEDSALGSTFDSEDEIALEDYFDDFAQVPEPEPQPSLNTNSQTVLTDIGSQTFQTDIPSTLRPITQPTIDEPSSNTNSKAASGSKPKKKRGRPRKNIVTEIVVVEEAAGADNDNGESSQAPLFGLSDAEDYNSDQLNSDCDIEGDNGQSKTKFQTFKLLDSMCDYKWEVGTFFVTKKAFQDGIRTYAVHNGYDLKFIKNDKKRMRVVCKKVLCPWKAFCAKIDGEETWQLRKIIDDHNCGRVFKVKMLTSKWLGGKLNNTVRENAGIELNKIMTKTQQKWNLVINKTKAYRAKSYAIDVVDGSYRDQYTRMYDYCHEILSSNPNSTVRVQTQPFQGVEGEEQNTDRSFSPHFKRVYICFKACKDSFEQCRKIIGLDGCFLKGYYGGQLLTAIGRDPNDQMLPIAYAVVEGETKESWTWFLDLLISDLGGARVCNTYTFISDQQKGLLPAMADLLPDVEHRFCVRHLYNNFRKKYPGKKLKELMWKAAKATYENAFEKHMNEIKAISEEAYNHLMQTPAKVWSKSKFTNGPLCDTLVNNMTEAFNSVIVGPREKPVVTMLEELRVYLMERWEKNRQKGANYEDSILPNIKKILAKESSYTNNLLVRRGSEFDYEVRYLSMTGNGEETFVVNLLRRECSCRKWLITGLPCCRAIASMKSQNIDIDQYVPDCFRKENYEACYRSIIYPTNGQALWRRTEYADLQPPPIKRQAGRPKKKRRKDADEKRDEQQLKRSKNGVKCSRCKEEGHNKSTCKLPPPPPATATDGNTGANATASASAQSAATITTTANAIGGNSTTSAATGNASTHSMRSGTTLKPSQKSKNDKAPKRASLSQPTTKKKKTSLGKKKGSTSTQPQNT